MLKKSFINWVETKDVKNIRKELLSILNSNPDLKNGEFKEYLEYAEKHIG